ncbi:hypothetical protein [Butyrivibrio sp. INlla16]|uniref:hypothetical protein n=1 Tax=Butyrivibrio sp. INlla16 TaxID=1520807 RepID=UPI00088A339C|nr:hypothetical protein [Butyrivibrio sp. INlla16]SDB50310.1 hypothetical protein SAMN02910263_02519 [Butyrivibrio sp. INlla16]
MSEKESKLGQKVRQEDSTDHPRAMAFSADEVNGFMIRMDEERGSMNKRAFARLIGYSEGYLRMIRRMERPMTIQLVFNMAKHGIDVRYILGNIRPNNYVPDRFDQLMSEMRNTCNEDEMNHIYDMVSKELEFYRKIRSNRSRASVFRESRE